MCLVSKRDQLQAFTRQTKVGKLVLANSCFHTSKTRQITTHASFQHWRRSVMAFTGSCHLCLACISCLSPEKKQHQFLRYLPHFLLLIFVTFIGWGRNVPQSRNKAETKPEQSRTITHCVNKLKCRFKLIVRSLVRHFVKCHDNHVNRARILIGSKLETHVCQSFTGEIRVYQHEKVGEKVGEDRDEFSLSPTVVVFHTHQLEFANFSLSCEGRFRLTSTPSQGT